MSAVERPPRARPPPRSRRPRQSREDADAASSSRARPNLRPRRLRSRRAASPAPPPSPSAPRVRRRFSRVVAGRVSPSPPLPPPPPPPPPSRSLPDARSPRRASSPRGNLRAPPRLEAVVRSFARAVHESVPALHAAVSIIPVFAVRIIRGPASSPAHEVHRHRRRPTRA